MKFLVNGKTNRYRLLYTLLLVLAAGQIFLGFIWIVKNMGTVPAYGDTPEYLALSKTMALDGYRTFLYPLFLREVIKASTFLHLQYQIIAYLCQLFVSFVSLVYFTGTFFVQNRFLTRAYEKNKIRTAVETLLLSLFIFANPLVAHFNLSILTDSFALSFTLIFLGAIVRMLLFERLRARDIAVGLLAYFFMAETRPERNLLGIGFLLLTVILLVFISKFKITKPMLKKIAALACIGIVGFLSVTIINNKTQYNKTERVQPSVSQFIYSITVGDSLRVLYPYLPPAITEIVTYQDAVQNDTTDQQGNQVVGKILQHDHGDAAKINTISEIAFQKRWPQITGHILLNFGKNMISPVMYDFDHFLHDPMINWTWTRMGMYHPFLSSIYQTYSKIILLFTFIGTAFAAARRRLFFGKKFIACSLILITEFSLFFTLNSYKFGFHIRYAMPIYTVFVTFTAFITLSSLKLPHNIRLKGAVNEAAVDAYVSTP